MARKRAARGSGSVWEIKSSGHWRAEVPQGKGLPPLRKVFKTEREANRWRIATAAARDANTLATAPQRATVADRVAAWLAGTAGTVDPSTLESYRSELERLVLPGLGGLKLADLTPARVRHWLDGLAAAGWSADKRGRAVQQAKAVLAADVGTLLPSNPFDRVKRPRAARKPVAAYTREQAAALLTAAQAWAGGRYAVLVRLALDSGMRPQELRALRWEDVDLDAGLIRVRRALRTVKNAASEKQPKSAAGRRDVWLTPATAAALTDHRAKQAGAAAASGLVFPTRTGQWQGKRNLARQFRLLSGKAGVPPLGLKTLRHTSATLLLAAGAPLKAVSVRLGHESVETTLRFYAAVLPSDQERVRQVATEVFG